jgi:hypothetical protein
MSCEMYFGSGFASASETVTIPLNALAGQPALN